MDDTITVSLVGFQSTLSSRRATNLKFRHLLGQKISIHALLTESDSLSGGGIVHVGISIHALLTESDSVTDNNYKIICNFNPRSPHGERRTSIAVYL